MAPVKRKSEENIHEKTKERKRPMKAKAGKQHKPITEKAKGIVIKEASTKSETETDTAESKAKKSTTKMREYVVKSSYSLRSGMKGPGVNVAPEFEKIKAEKEKEKVTEITQDSETDSKEVRKNAKNDVDSDDNYGDGGEKYNYGSFLGLKLDCKKLAEECNATHPA